MPEPVSRAAPALDTEDVPLCPVCKQQGSVVYENLSDRLYHTPGAWRFRRCSNEAACGSYWLDPRPTVLDIGRAYESYLTHDPDGRQRDFANRLVGIARREYLAHHYGYSVGTLPAPAGRLIAALTHLFPGFRAAFDLEVRGLGPSASGRLLDVGCGDGTDLAQLRDLGWQAEGVEVDREAVKVARDRGLTVHQGTLDGQRFPSDSFDVVTMSHVVEHLHDPEAVLRECRRILKPGGSLIVATPNVRGMLHRKYRQHWLALDPPRHLLLFSQIALASVARAAGFAQVHTRSTVRNEDMLDYSSRIIRSDGRFTWGYLPPLHKRLSSHLVQTVAPVFIALGFAEGDEIMMTARK
jgi:2-polyprenyl-3-methyl-5-hydroxy-6-metoxy-1,4-benzoquinol methylase